MTIRTLSLQQRLDFKRLYLPKTTWHTRPNMPNICQTDVRSSFLTNYGENACGPASASNILKWLSNNGYPNLHKDQSLKGQFRLIEDLYDLMKTDEDGTLKNNMLFGLETFIKDKGYLPQVSWHGEDPGENYNNGEIIDLSWIMEKLEKNLNIILLLGFYNFDDTKKEYIRNTGHFVTVTGVDGYHLVTHDSEKERNHKPMKYSFTTMTRNLAGKQNLRLLNFTEPYTDFIVIDGAANISIW